MANIEDILAKIYDRTQRTQAQSAHRTVKRWIIVDMSMRLAGLTSTVTTYNYPALWGGDTPSAPANMRWGEGAWA